MGNTMETLIRYRTPGDLFNPGKRPPGHVLDPIIRSAARTASETLQELGVQHRTEYIDGRDGRDGTPARSRPSSTGPSSYWQAPGRSPCPYRTAGPWKARRRTERHPAGRTCTPAGPGAARDPGENPGAGLPGSRIRRADSRADMGRKLALSARSTARLAQGENRHEPEGRKRRNGRNTAGQDHGDSDRHRHRHRGRGPDLPHHQHRQGHRRPAGRRPGDGNQ